jgi:DNA-binding NarL/FixJ family response regulator
MTAVREEGSPAPVPAPLRVRIVAPVLERATELAQHFDEAGIDVEVVVGRTSDARRPTSPERRFDVLVLCALERPADLRDILRGQPSIPVVVVGSALNVADARRLLEAGATGFCDEDSGLELLPHVAHLAAHGQLSLPARMREVVEPISLSTRERQVLALMASGLSNPEIAEQMFISESTVKSHAASAFRRLGVHSRREAVALVLGGDETLRRTVLMSHPLENQRTSGRDDDPRRSGTFK